ncbi:MAG TPA: hypothetical protein VKU80_01840 [Planctomycetota bacterium]|nr:hypothetical protein [Planctomycetota bacterium]
MSLDRRTSSEVYGELNILLTVESIRYELAVTEVADGLNTMFLELLNVLAACCEDAEERNCGFYRDFSMRREGARLLIQNNHWFNPDKTQFETSTEGLRCFSVDLKDIVRRSFLAAHNFHAEMIAAIGSGHTEIMAPFKSAVDECEARAMKAL